MNRSFIFIILVIIVSLAFTLNSCSRVGTGEVGIVLDFNRQIKDKAIVNEWEFHLLDTLIIVDSTQIRVPILNAKAKDIDGILFVDIDAQITYNIIEENAPQFFKLTKELDTVEGNQTLGFRVVSKEAKNALVKSFTHFKAMQASTDKAQIEAKTLQMLTEELDRRFPNTFTITDVNIDQALLKKERLLLRWSFKSKNPKCSIESLWKLRPLLTKSASRYRNC